MKHLKHIISEYKKWWLRGVKYHLFLENNMYFLKAMLKLFVPIQKERIKLLIK